VRDPHVQTLHYAVGSGEGISYRDPEAISFVNHLGAFDLFDGKLGIAPAEHFSEEKDARRAIEPFLRAWEMDADLRLHLGMIRFTFERAELVDRNPPSPGSPQVIHMGVASLSLVGHSISLHLTCSTYPQPPAAFRATPEVQHAYRRWMRYRSGQEPLQAMAYFVLTLLESAAGDRRNAARSFNIDVEVLRTIGKLSSTRGDPETARKASLGTGFQDLTGTERQWLENAIPMVIRRLGEHASGASLPPIRLDDLPSI
jgi:hypothetical protein